MVDAVVSVLLDKLVTFLLTETRQLLEYEDQFNEIKRGFQYMQGFLKVADGVKRKDRTEILKTVMNDLRELVYDVQDIIADCQLLSQKKCQGRIQHFSSCFSPAFLKSRCLMGRRLRNITKRMRDVEQNMRTYLDKVPFHGRKEIGENIPLTYPILMTEDSIVGLEDESRKIIDQLLVKNEYLKVIGIVGMGGIGKTTLAQKICKSEIIETNFKYSIFVTVSQSFQLDELLKEMLNNLEVAGESLHGKGVNYLLKMLKDKLDDKFLIVLDDVWKVDERQWWDSLASALPKEKGGCVIVTTRNEEVARSMGATDGHIYHAEILSEENSWSLFCKVAFARNGGISPNAELEKCGKEIVAGCGGLPLTIRTVGGMMLAKDDSIGEWGRISKHLKEEMTKDELVISRLELSYEELPMHLRPCLLCFAMYPEDAEQGAIQIIKMWIGEGFVWGKEGKTAFEIGKECLNELCNRCLILKDEEENDGITMSFYMVHDAVREMLMEIAIEEGFFSMNRGDGLSRRAVMFENIAQESIENNYAKLRTLAVFNAEGKDSAPILEANLRKLKRLRMLHLSLSRADPTIESIPSTKWLRGIGSLHHLVYLFLENIDALRTLPDSIGNLCNLRILTISACHNLESLPTSITMLKKMIGLSVVACPSIECLPKGLGKLSNLEQLSCVKSDDDDVTNSWISLSELKKLTKLRHLYVEISEEEQAGAEEWNVLQMPESLQILCLGFPGVSLANAAVIARKMDRRLSHPLQCLKELVLRLYPGERTPAWLSPTYLPNLQHLGIFSGRIEKLGPGFLAEDDAWKVETLVLQGMEELEEDWAIIERAMPFLRHAHVRDCPKLKYSEEAFQPGPHNWRTWKKYHRGESSSSSLAA